MKQWMWVPAVLIAIGFLTFLMLWYLRPSSALERKDFVQLVTQMVGGAALLAGLFFTWWNLSLTQQTATSSLRNAQKTLRIAQEGQIADRFTKAISQLGSKDDTAVRLGGIYALERIARDSERDHWPIMEILTAFVRQNAGWLDKPARQADTDA